MAVRFEHTGDTIRLTQTRRGLRITFAMLPVLATLGMLMVLLISRTRFPTTLACDHGSGSCTLTVGKAARPIPIDSIRTARLVNSTTSDHASWVWLRTERSQSLCRSREPAGQITAASFASDLNAFLADRTHAPIELHCVTQGVNGGPPPLSALPFSFLGLLLLALIFARFSEEVTAVLDRRADTIESKGRGWLMRAWNVKRPLSEVAQIEVRGRYAGYGQYRYLVYAVFRDGSDVLLWSPAATTMVTLEDRVAKMRAFVTPA